jgi:hypothetical protein
MCLIIEFLQRRDQTRHLWALSGSHTSSLHYWNFVLHMFTFSICRPNIRDLLKLAIGSLICRFIFYQTTSSGQNFTVIWYFLIPSLLNVTRAAFIHWILYIFFLFIRFVRFLLYFIWVIMPTLNYNLCEKYQRNWIEWCIYILGIIWEFIIIVECSLWFCLI